MLHYDQMSPQKVIILYSFIGLFDATLLSMSPQKVIILYSFIGLFDATL